MQGLSGIPLLIGVGLVVYSLRQTEYLNRDQLATEGSMISFQNESAAMGDDIAETLGRIADPNASLTNSDFYRYDAWAMAKLQLTQRNKKLSEWGVHATDWRMFADEAYVCWAFGHDVGRAWLKSAAVPKVELVEHMLKVTNGCVDKETFIDELRRNVSASRNRVARVLDKDKLLLSDSDVASTPGLIQRVAPVARQSQ